MPIYDRPVSNTFVGRVVVVTGASQGIGKAICLELARQRPKLVLAARDAAALGRVAAACWAAGTESLVVPTDVTSEEGCRALVEKTVERFGGIDMLVANAGMSMWSRLDEVEDLGLYERLFRLNVLGCVYPTYYALPHLKRSRGRIVGVSSVAGLNGVPTRTGYSATKHALFGFFDSLRIELKGDGVSVTVAAPDFVVSEIHRRAVGPGGQPLGESPMQEGKIMSAEQCARRIVRAAARRDRLWIGSLRGRVGRFVKLVAPGLVDAIAARAIRERR
jgi:NAD(P)-dependent dehydrogenase (short-subunit alcohol dehydrogenase family)